MGLPEETRHATEARRLRGVLTGALAFQILLGLLLFAGDLGRDFTMPGGGSDAPEFRMPTSPGDQTRRYDPKEMPATRPAGPGIRTDGPLPDRLVLEERDGAFRLSGSIERGDGERIARQISARMTAEAPPKQVFLNSPGGSVTDALELGRAIRAAGLGTAMEDGDICLSACPYIFAAGVTRRAEDGARIGVHQHYFGENTLLPAFIAVSDIQRGQGLVVEYLVEMGIDLRLMQPALITPPEEIYLLSREELEEFNLVTSGS